jgi:DNA-binding beta-propeller fold protein YncE
MKSMIAWLGATVMMLLASAASAQTAVPQFQVDPFWPKPLPNNWILGQVSGIATDRFDRIWVVHRPSSLTPRERAAEQNPPEAKCCVAAPPVLVFDQSGNLVRHWGGAGAGYQWPESEHGVFIDGNDFVWLAGNGKKDGQLLKFTMEGKFVLQIGKQGQGSDSNSTEQLGSPADVAVDVAAKEVFAADGYGNRRVVVFDSETGAYKRHWGAYGNKPSDEKTPAYDPAKAPSQQFGNPVHCIRIDKDGLVYVCDRTNDRLQIFRKDGSFVAETRGTGSVYDLVFSPDPEQKFIYMIDGMNGEVRIVDHASKQTLARFGRPGRQIGQFTALHNIAVDRQGNIFTSEVNTGQRVQKFRRIDMQN